MPLCACVCVKSVGSSLLSIPRELASGYSRVEPTVATGLVTTVARVSSSVRGSREYSTQQLQLQRCRDSEMIREKNVIASTARSSCSAAETLRSERRM